MPGPTPRPLAERLMAKVSIRPSGCWEWTGSLRGGYGQIWTSADADGRRQLLAAHRASFELARGPIPQGLDLDHLCRNTICVNPEHLEPVTRRVNVLRGEGRAADNARKAKCAAGHTFADARFSDGRRRCLECYPAAQTAGHCDHCSNAFERKAVGGRRRRFCSDQCRIAFHNARPKSRV